MRSLLVLLPLACAAAAAGPARAADTVADKVFGPGLLGGVSSPEVLRYRYELSGATMAEPFDAPVAMDVREVASDGGKKVYFDMFEGKERRQFGPMEAREQNPLVIVFLQRDVTEMGNLTGGSPQYFQQQIRKAFAEPAETTPVEVELDGRKVPATKLVMRPFTQDPRVEQFVKFKDKAYVFVVAPEVPGGLYRIGTLTADPQGRPVVDESMTFERVERPAPGAGDAAGGRS